MSAKATEAALSTADCCFGAQSQLVTCTGLPITARHLYRSTNQKHALVSPSQMLHPYDRIKE